VAAALDPERRVAARLVKNFESLPEKITARVCIAAGTWNYRDVAELANARRVSHPCRLDGGIYEEAPFPVAALSEADEAMAHLLEAVTLGDT
jgi:hypothetical protein